MRAIRLRFFAGLAVCAMPTSAQADTVCEWMEYANRIVDADAGARAADITSTQVPLAMFEALNSIDRRYASVLNLPLADADASQDVAAMTAAWRVMRDNYPAQTSTLDDNYNLAMAGIADGPAKEAGRAAGEAAARAVLAAGGIDPAIEQIPYRPRARAGEWSATALPVIGPDVAAYRPWVLPRFDAVRPPPPPALTSERYARDFDEVRRLGGRNSTERTPVQSLMARYRITPNMTPTLRLIADAPGRSAVQNARMFAMLAMASDDSRIAIADAKLHYNFWRPITAIRNAADDGNDATVEVADWVPLINTPNHPEYPCGHCIFAAVTATVLAAETGPRPAGGVRVASDSIPIAAIQPLASWDEWVGQVSFSRTLGGVHYRFSNEAAETMGREIGRRALAQLMRPLPRSARRPAR